ncbi:FkbM family methyltransferase [bacterium]|nr:FkbM family methyltransferase [bacterium]
MIRNRFGFGSRGRQPLASTERKGLVEISEFASLDRTQLENRIRNLATYAPLAEGVGLARVLGRYKLYVAPDDDAISTHLILDGFWEMWNTIFLTRFVRPGWSIVEIGANLGYFTLLLSELTGETGRVVAFEPVNRIADLLTRTIDVNGMAGRCTIERRAVADRSGDAAIHVPRGNWGGGTIVGHPSSNLAASEAVELVSLDEYCRQHALTPDFIRMDAEGAEHLIWRGMSDVIARASRIAVLFEFDVRRQPSWRSWFQDIQKQGFELARVGYDSKLSPLAHDMAEPTGMIEVLARKGFPA